jgi:hypothetical protein
VYSCSEEKNQGRFRPVGSDHSLVSECFSGLCLNSVPIEYALTYTLPSLSFRQHEQKDNFIYVVIRRVSTVQLLSLGLWSACRGREGEPMREHNEYFDVGSRKRVLHYS